MSNISVKKAYDNITEEWASYRNKSFLSNLVIEFATYVKASGRILDIGCGTGYPIATYLSEKGFDITGIDFSQNMIEKAKELNLKNANFECADFFKFSSNEKYDGVIAFDSFFHFPKKKQKQIYDKVASCMNEGSYLLFTHGLINGEIYGEMFGHKFYHSSLDKEELYKLLAKANLEVVWEKVKYVEKNIDRDLVILAKKINPKSSVGFMARN